MLFPSKKSFFICVSVAVICFVFTASESYAKPNPEKLGNTTVTKPLQVKGQTRTLSMMLVLKNKKEKNEFISPRENYRREILSTRY